MNSWDCSRFLLELSALVDPGLLPVCGARTLLSLTPLHLANSRWKACLRGQAFDRSVEEAERAFARATDACKNAQGSLDFNFDLALTHTPEADALTLMDSVGAVFSEGGNRVVQAAVERHQNWPKGSSILRG